MFTIKFKNKDGLDSRQLVNDLKSKGFSLGKVFTKGELLTIDFDKKPTKTQINEIQNDLINNQVVIPVPKVNLKEQYKLLVTQEEKIEFIEQLLGLKDER